MKPEIIYCEQKSDEWFEARLGRVTASHFADVLSNGSTRHTYMMKLLSERMTGERMETYSAKWMDEGSEKEPLAREYYEGLNGVTVEQVGLVVLGDDIGASPDGLIGTDGTLEIKCPFPNTHLGYILDDKLPAVYKPQVQGGLWITERQWCDFVSFDPRVKNRPFWCIRVQRDESYIQKLIAGVDKFVAELKALEDRILPF